MRAWTVSLWVVAALLGGASTAALADDESASARALFREATERTRAGEARDAVRLLERIVAEHGTSGEATRAERRLRWFAARREGDYAPLGVLLRFQSAPWTAQTEADVNAFAREVDAFPPGLVRVEAWLALGAGRARFGQREDALRRFRAVLDDTHADHRARVVARRELARLLGESGELEAARAAVAEPDPERGGAPVDARLVLELEIAQRARYLRPLAYACLGALFAFVALLALRRELRLADLRTILHPARLLGAAVVLFGPFVIGGEFDHEAGESFLRLGLGAGGVVLLTAIAATGLPRADVRRRRALVVVALLAQGAVAYLVLLGSHGIFGLHG